MELQTSKSKREIEKSLYELVESAEKEARVPVARAVYRRIQLYSDIKKDPANWAR